MYLRTRFINAHKPYCPTLELENCIVTKKTRNPSSFVAPGMLVIIVIVVSPYRLYPRCRL
jgi:hypothetical protein